MAASPRTSHVVVVLLLVLGVWRALATQGKLDPLKHREARDKTDVDARKEYYRNILKQSNGCPHYDPPEDQRSLPTVPNSFTTNIEISFQRPEDHIVIYGQEMYDGVLQRGILNYEFAQLVIEDRPKLITENIHYNVKRDEALFIFLNEGCAVTGLEDCNTAKNCTAGTLKDLKRELKQIFGVVAHSGDGGFLGASSILEFGPQFNYTQKMMSQCHGLDCDVYETCIEIPEENATLLYSYYWSTPAWTMESSVDQVPIAVEIYGNKIEGHTVEEIWMEYDYFDYRREIRPTKYELEPPADVYCFHRKSELEPPIPAESFSMDSEIITGVDIPVHLGNNDTEYIRYRVVFPKKEYYDYSMRISRQDYVPLFALTNQRRFENQTSVVQDFNQGLSYVIQPRQKLCQITKILNVSHGDVVVGDDGSVFMESPWNYEDLDMEMQYNGNHWTRGLDTGVWVGIKSIPDLFDMTYVWYFASPLTHEIPGLNKDANIPLPTIDHVPVKLEKYITFLGDLPHTTINIYNYESQVPHVHIHDISLCYTSEDMKDLTFNMPGDSLNKTRHKREHLKYALMFALSEAGVVSPLRINRLEIKEIPDAVQVNFTLLEKPDLVGDVEMAGMENTLEKAYTAIKSKIDKSQLIVAVHLSLLEVVQLVAKPNTMQNIERDDGIIKATEKTGGHTAGAMAGLGISMVIVGAIAGFAGIYLFSRK